MLISKKWTKKLLIFTLIFNVIDIVISIRHIRYGLLKESNPFMETLLSMNSLVPFILGKSLLICFGCYILLKYSEYLIAQLGAYLAFCCYFALVLHFYYFL